MAVHGVMTGHLDPVHARRLNGLDLVVPDVQPVRWALNWLHGTGLRDRVYGPELLLRVASELAKQDLPLFLYGSRPEVLRDLVGGLRRHAPGLVIAGTQPSRFRRESEAEREQTLQQIRASGARAVAVGLGCPRQETWAFENAAMLDMPVLAVGAAFDFHAGRLPQAPPQLQRIGLEWLFRLTCEPRRLWRRYLLLNPLFVMGVVGQALGVRSAKCPLPDGSEPIERFA